MMNNKFHKTIKTAQKLSLSVEEKEQMKASLLNHMAENPPIAEVMWKEERAPILSYFNFNMLGKYVVPALALVLIISAGTSVFASGNALPGDLLYPIKILGEKIQSSLAISGVEKEKVDTEHAVARLEEAETLQAEGKLDEEKKAALADSFKENRHDNTPESKDNFLKKLPESLQSIAIIIDPSFIATSSESDHKVKENHKAEHNDYRVAKQKDDNNKTTAATAATMSTSGASTSSAIVPSIQKPTATVPHL